MFILKPHCRTRRQARAFEILAGSWGHGVRSMTQMRSLNGNSGDYRLLCTRGTFRSLLCITFSRNDLLNAEGSIQKSRCLSPGHWPQ
jgi:hypothetical protein